MSESNELSAEGQRTLAALREAGRRALERKARLGQYAVVWEDGHPVIVGGETTDEPQTARGDTPSRHNGKL